MELSKLVISDWIHVSLELALGDGEKVVDCWNGMYLFGEFLFGGSTAEKWGDHWKYNFFINNSVEALILLKEVYQGLLGEF